MCSMTDSTCNQYPVGAVVAKFAGAAIVAVERAMANKPNIHDFMVKRICFMLQKSCAR